MEIHQVLALYDSEVRARPQAQPGLNVERAGGVMRLTGPFNFVSWWDFPADTAPSAVAEQVGYFRTRGETLLWRVHEHDRPADLPGHLAAQGFIADEATTLMLFDLASASETLGPVRGTDVRRASTLDELDGFVSVGGLAFGEEESWRREAYADRLADPDLGLYVAYVDGQPVASARIEMSAAWSFGLLQGGGVAPAHRGLGLYRALVAARAEEARARGLRYLVSDARETSRPILQRLGFVPASRAVLWTLKP